MPPATAGEERIQLAVRPVHRIASDGALPTFTTFSYGSSCRRAGANPNIGQSARTSTDLLTVTPLCWPTAATVCCPGSAVAGITTSAADHAPAALARVFCTSL